MNASCDPDRSKASLACDPFNVIIVMLLPQSALINHQATMQNFDLERIYAGLLKVDATICQLQSKGCQSKYLVASEGDSYEEPSNFFIIKTRNVPGGSQFIRPKAFHPFRA